jgi:hypothetical protein
LTVNVNGQGTVAFDPPGGTYAGGTPVQLTANAADGWRFDRWSGDLESWSNPATILMAGPKAVTARFWPFGDANCDSVVNFGDINAFVLAISDTAIYASTYPQCPLVNADLNSDSTVDFLDISPFVELLSGP